MCREICYHDESHLVSSIKTIEPSTESKTNKISIQPNENETYSLDKESLILRNVKIKVCESIILKFYSN